MNIVLDDDSSKLAVRFFVTFVFVVSSLGLEMLGFLSFNRDIR